MSITNYRPANYAEFQALIESLAPLRKFCLRCHEAFSEDNVRTPNGWRETQISGYCEDCWDEIFAEEE